MNTVCGHNMLIYIKNDTDFSNKEVKTIVGMWFSSYLCTRQKVNRLDCFRLVVIFIVLGF